jgi:hypothetical protein
LLHVVCQVCKGYRGLRIDDDGVSSVADASLADLRQFKGPNRLSRKMRLNFTIHVGSSPSSKELFVHKGLPKIWSWSDVEKIMA